MSRQLTFRSTAAAGWDKPAPRRDAAGTDGLVGWALAETGWRLQKHSVRRTASATVD